MKRRVSSRLQPWLPLLLAICSIVIRLGIWNHLPSAYRVTGPSVELYIQALTQHFSEYLAYDHTEPPGMYLVHALLLQLFGTAVFTQAFVLWAVFVFDTIAVLLVDATSRQLGVPRLLSWVLSAVYSVALLPFEVWRSGCHVDHYTIWLVALFAWALVKRVLGAQRRYDLAAAVAGGLLVGTQKVAFLIAPLMIGVSWFWLQGHAAARARRSLVALAGPLLVSVVLVGHNAVSNGTYATSSLGGANQAQFVWAAQDYQTEKVYELAVRSGVPDWYLWCFRQAERIHVMAPFNGGCMLQDGAEGMRYDFGPLQDYLTAQGETRLLQVVAGDQAILSAHPYLKSFLVPESSPRFVAEYNKVSSALFYTLLTQQPLALLKQLARAHYRYLMDGWRFFALLMHDTTGHAVEPMVWMPSAWVILLATAICGLMFVQAYFAAYLLLARALLKGGALPTDRGVFVLIAGMLSTSGAFTFVCCENGRYFLQVTPYLIPLLGVFLHHVVLQPSWRLRGPA